MFETLDGRVATFRRVLCVAGLALFAVTWRLWFPTGEFPRIPLVAAAFAIPDWFDFVAAGAAMTALLAGAICRRERLAAIALGLFVILAVALVVANQHRIQPWLYELLILAVVLATCTPRRALLLIRVVVVSVYFYSAVSKFDYQFLHTVGQQFLSTLFGFLPVDVQQWPVATRVRAALIFPVAELLLAVMLCIPRLHRAGVVLGVAMHIGLLLILGPFGLKHHHGVLVWNLFFILQLVLLFWCRSESTLASDLSTNTEANANRSLGTALAWCAHGLVAAAVVLPLTESFGYWDHWPSWGLYSPNNSRFVVFVQPNAVDELPTSLRQLLPDDVVDRERIRLPIDAWSFKELSVPLYPQARFQLGVAMALSEQIDGDFNLLVIRQSMSDRRTGRRDEETLLGCSALRDATRHYWLNAVPY